MAEDVRKGTVCNVKWDGIELDAVGDDGSGEFLKDAFRRGSRFLWPALSGSLQFCAMQSAR